MVKASLPIQIHQMLMIDLVEDPVDQDEKVTEPAKVMFEALFACLTF